MSSSPIPLSDVSMRRAVGLAEVLGDLPDPRGRHGVRHRLVGVVLVAVAAVCAGARSYAAIGDWAVELGGDDLARLGLTRARAPEESTFLRVFAALDAAVLDGLVGAFLRTRTAIVGGRRVIAIDGKTVRGARTATTPAPHLVAAFEHASGAVLGQLATTAKSNELMGRCAAPGTMENCIRGRAGRRRGIWVPLSP